MLSCPVPRHILFNPPIPTLVYVDASGPGHIGAATVFDNTVKVAHTHLPGWFVESNAIYEFELAGAIFGLTMANVLTPGRPILLCIDNDAASSTLVRGNSEKPLGRALASVFWLIAANFSCPIWIEQVRSKLNVADPPSRACKCIPDHPVIKLPNHGAPENFKTIFESNDAFGRHQFVFRESTRCFSEGWPCPQNNAETE